MWTQTYRRRLGIAGVRHIGRRPRTNARTEHPWALAFLVLSVLAGCASPAGSVQDDYRSPGPTASARPTTVATPELADAVALVSRLRAGWGEEVALFGRLYTTGLANVAAARAATVAISDWANGEHAWLNDQTIPPCLRVAGDAYGLGLRDVLLGSTTLAGLLVGSSSTAADIEAALRQLIGGGDQLAHAIELADAAVCVAGSSAAPTPADSLDVKAAYAALAATTNNAIAHLPSFTNDRDRVDQLLAIEEEALHGMSSWPSAGSEVAALRSSVAGVVAVLREAKASASDEAVKSSLLTATFSMNSELSDGSQRAAAAVVRKALGLPALADGDVL